MSLFLFKPHVTGPEGNITSPDVIVDRVFVDGVLRPVGMLTDELWQQMANDVELRAGYAVMALGGGALISPVVVADAGPLIVARQAWRLGNLDAHIGQVTLNGRALSEVGLPETMIFEAGGTDDALPRGYMLIQTAEGAGREAVLVDPVLKRELQHRVTVEPLEEDRWGDARPRPRYSVGPTQNEVPHYI